MSTETISELFSENPLISFTRRTNKYEVLERFNQILDSSLSIITAGSLTKFVNEKPFRYWDSEQVSETIKLLESNIDRSILAISERTKPINRGFNALNRQPNQEYFEKPLDLSRPRDLIDLTTIVLPQYLRWAEHIYSNLLEFYWSLIKSGSVKGKFQVRGALARVRKKSFNFLEKGYDDKVRNGIAHGDFSVSPFGLKFGTDYPTELTILEFQSLFDNLARTCNSLAIALIIFWSRQYEKNKNLDPVPISLISSLVSGTLDRMGFRLIGALESETPLAGKQLHIAIELKIKRRQHVIAECARTAYHYVNFGATNYDRYVIQVNQQEPVSSLAIIDPSRLLGLIKKDSPIDDLADAFGESTVLWFDEHKWRARLKQWEEIYRSGVNWLKLDVLERWHDSGLFLGKGCYRIRDEEIKSIQGIGRIRIRAVLKNPTHYKNPKIIKAIFSSIVSKYRWKLIPSRAKSLDAGLRIPKFPSYIWVDLFKEDGSLRWLKSGGWSSGNLVGVAEKIIGDKPPVLIKEPEDVHKGIRIRYSMNKERAAKNYAEFQDIFNEIWSEKTDT